MSLGIKLISTGIAIFFAFALGLAFLYAARDVLIVLFLGLILAAALRPVVLWLERRMPRLPAVLLIYLALLLVLSGVGLILVPPIVEQVGEVVSEAPEYWEQLEVLLENTEAAFPGLDIRGELQRLPEVLEPLAEHLIAVPLGIVSAVLGLLGVLFLSFYWLLERDRIVTRVTSLAPRDYRAHLLHMYERSEEKLGAYVRGQLVVSLIVGTLTLIGLLLLGVPYALLLAVIAAMLEVIPVLGPILAAIPAIAVATLDALWLGVAVTVFYIVVQQLESYVIAPKVQEVAVQISPFWILLAILVGGSVMGILGALIAVPAAVLVSVLVEELAPVEGKPSPRAEEVTAPADGPEG